MFYLFLFSHGRPRQSQGNLFRLADTPHLLVYRCSSGGINDP